MINSKKTGSKSVKVSKPKVVTAKSINLDAEPEVTEIKVAKPKVVKVVKPKVVKVDKPKVVKVEIKPKVIEPEVTEIEEIVAQVIEIEEIKEEKIEIEEIVAKVVDGIVTKVIEIEEIKDKVPETDVEILEYNINEAEFNDFERFDDL
jgi:hypothetical protein